MEEKPIRRTQARVLERQRRRAEQERKKRLKWQIPLGAIGLLVVLVVGYFVFTTVAKPKVANAGVIGPRWQVDTDKLDLGKQPLGKTVHASFDVKNTGDDALTLNAAQTATVLEGCWPPGIVVGQTTLQPGQSTTISMDFMMHEGMAGPHLFEVPVNTNDPKQSLVKLQVASDWGPWNEWAEATWLPPTHFRFIDEPQRL